MTSSTQLGCGREIDRVWDTIGSPADAHERDCPFCQAARSDLAALAEATRELAQREQQDPDLQPGPLVLDRVLSVARSEVRRGRRLPLRPANIAAGGRQGQLQISEQTIAGLVRRTGDRNAEVRIRRCAVELVTDPTEPTGDAVRVRVRLRVSVEATAAIPRALAVLREAIIDAVDLDVGIRVVAVDIDVEDVHGG